MDLNHLKYFIVWYYVKTFNLLFAYLQLQNVKYWIFLTKLNTEHFSGKSQNVKFDAKKIINNNSINNNHLIIFGVFFVLVLVYFFI